MKKTSGEGTQKAALFTYPAISGRGLYRSWFACLTCHEIHCVLLDPPLNLIDVIKSMSCGHGTHRSDVALLTEEQAIEVLKLRYERVEET